MGDRNHGWVVDQPDVHERVILPHRRPFTLLAPPLLHGAVDLLRGGERIRRVHPLITVFASELCGHQDAALALQEFRRHFGTEIVAVPVPVHALIATVGECLHGP